LTIHTLEEVSTKTSVRKLVKGKKFQKWLTQEPLVVFSAFISAFVYLFFLLLVDNRGSRCQLGFIFVV
jgi:hypothetical protein